MLNDYNRDTRQDALARLAASLGVNSDMLKKSWLDIKPTTSSRSCLDINDQPASATDADKQTQKRPCEPAVEVT